MQRAIIHTMDWQFFAFGYHKREEKMKIYTDSENKIVALRQCPQDRPDLKEIELDVESKDSLFFQKCDNYILGFRYGEDICGETEEGKPITGIVIVPYKDIELLEKMQLEFEKNFAISQAAFTAAAYVPDSAAVTMKILYRSWESYIGGSLKTGDRVVCNNLLYKVRQDISAVLENQPPSVYTAALYEEIVENYAGTLEDPIPYNNNMELIEGKYYSQDGVTYLCTNGSGQAVYSPLEELVGIYVEVVE